MRARCFPLLKGISLPLPSSADSWGCSLNDGKKQGLLHQPISNTQNIKNAGGGREERVGDEDQCSSGNWELSSPGFPPLSSNPDQEPKNEENVPFKRTTYCK